jgi:hypothetical protein
VTPNVARRLIAESLIFILAAALGLPSCFFDSRWGQAKRAQVAAAQNATPSALRATPGAEVELGAPQPSKAIRALKLRAHATPRYAAAVTDWPRQLADQIDEVNHILGPTLSVRLELAGAEPWSPSRSDDDLFALSDELVALDAGEGVDWVVGLLGQVPRVELSFHELGLGQVNGKHFLVRAMNDARDYEAIQRELTELGEHERAKLYRARKRHKSATVFLHELGHTLGAPHEVDARTIMHARYDSRVEGYSPAAAQLMRLTLDHRLDPAAQTEQAFTQALLDHLRRTEATWVPAEREQAIARLEAKLQASASRPARAARERPATPLGRPDESTAPAPAVSGENPLSALGPADRATFEQADAAQRAGQLADALRQAKPLFKAYPDVLAVQDLRCRIATAVGGTWDEIQAQCERLMQLTRGSAPSRKRK